MKKKIILSASLLGLLFFSGISNSATKEILANDEISVQETSEIINESSEIDSSFIKSDEIINETEKTTLTEEQVEEIVKQISNKILGEELTDKLFATFGLGIILIVVLYIAFQINERIKNKTAYNTLSNNMLAKQEISTNELIQINKDNQKKIDEMTEMNTKNQELLDQYKAEIVNLETLNNKYVTDYKMLVKSVLETSTEATNILKEYSKIDGKINALLDCMNLLSETPDGVREGISRKVKEKVKGVKANEQKES